MKRTSSGLTNLLGGKSIAFSLSLALLLTACAKQQEPAQAVEAAPAAKTPEAKEKASEEERAAEPGSAAARGAPGVAPPPAPAPQAGGEAAGKADLLSPDDETKKEGGIDGAMSELEASFSDLQKALALSAPDCVTAKQLRDRVCDLAEHICRLADEGAGTAAQELCGDGRGRCTDAKRRYEQVCATP